MRRLGRDNSDNLAVSLSEHALTLRKLGRLKKGFKVLQGAIRLWREGEREWKRQDLARALRRCALLLHTMKRHTEARESFEAACEFGLQWVERERGYFNADSTRRNRLHV